MIAEIPLEPLVVEPPRRRRRWRLVGVATVALLASGAAALFTRGRDTSPPHLAPTYLPAAFSPDPTVWSFASEPGAEPTADYGHVGPDGRLDRWLQLQTSTGGDPQYEMFEERDGRRLWIGGHARG